MIALAVSGQFPMAASGQIPVTVNKSARHQHCSAAEAVVFDRRFTRTLPLAGLQGAGHLAAGLSRPAAAEPLWRNRCMGGDDPDPQPGSWVITYLQIKHVAWS